MSENAEKMGGDPAKIVINGESAGSGMVMALLLHKPSTELLSGAIAQSGGTMLNFLGTIGSQPIGSEEINLVISDICGRFSSCDASSPPIDQINQLKSVDGGALFDIGMEMQLFWGPVPKDGTFWKEDALEQYMNNELNSGFKVKSSLYTYYVDFSGNNNNNNNNNNRVFRSPICPFSHRLHRRF